MNLSVGNKSMGKQNLAVDDKPLRIVASTGTNEVEKKVQDGDACKGRQVDILRIDSEGNDTEQVEFESSSEKKLPLENAREKCALIPSESNHYQVQLNSAIVVEEKGEAVQFEGNSGKQIIVCPEAQSLGTKSSDVSDRQGLKRDFNEQLVVSDRMVVLALMSESECPRRHGRDSSKYNLIGGENESKEKKDCGKGGKNSKKFKIREGLWADDISFRKEKIESLGTKPSDVSGLQRGLKRDFNEQQVVSDRITVLALMSESECPWRHGRGFSKHNLESKEKKVTRSRNGLKNSKMLKIRAGLCVDDISFGKEKTKICALNTIDNENPPLFQYSTSMMYPNWCNPVPPEGCNCTNGCSDSERCPCAVKNGGEIPFNHKGAIIEAKSLVYECGPNCRCPSSCYNRVSQHGVKFQLEIFKTKTRGWGVRSPNSIPSGSFVCEYIGELLDEKEAEERTGNDEYLFDIGNNCNDNTIWDTLSTHTPDSRSRSSEVAGDGGFTIDGAQYGNVGRFINHSCSPNLYAQNVLYDHDDNRIPHIMFFAAENIPPLQELTYDYNYIIDQIYDSDGNIKKKDCYCGSVECTGRMY
ncbi:hypothetical protein L6164_028034 [Bauhinia variegata]|uniref:Uncharacterized protein n=1 Tax=Bauhinia variegata TaxID=167791 RepID=A0ACB9LWC8_BAUVA|nr:hypothetical protein L6164_028034 [Bauhinia variegata]